jgi:hypothetical protein
VFFTNLRISGLRLAIWAAKVIAPISETAIRSFGWAAKNATASSCAASVISTSSFSSFGVKMSLTIT